MLDVNCTLNIEYSTSNNKCKVDLNDTQSY